MNLDPGKLEYLAIFFKAALAQTPVMLSFCAGANTKAIHACGCILDGPPCDSCQMHIAERAINHAALSILTDSIAPR